MSKAIVNAGQSWEDLAIQHLGDQEAVFALLRKNNTDLATPPAASASIDLSEVQNKRVAKIYSENGYQPSSEGVLVLNNEYFRVIVTLKGDTAEAIPRPGQNWEDLAIQYLGDQEAVFALLRQNKTSLAANIAPGVNIGLPSVLNPSTRKYFADGGYFPASATDVVLEGIDYWGIEIDFEVQ